MKLSISMVLVGLPFAAKGFLTQDNAAWATAFLALVFGFAFAWLNQRITAEEI